LSGDLVETLVTTCPHPEGLEPHIAADV
jgi:hypothetical protein